MDQRPFFPLLNQMLFIPSRSRHAEPLPSLQGYQDKSWDSGNLSASSLISPAGDVAEDVLDGIVFRGFPAGKAQLGHHRHQEPAHLPLVPTQQLRRFS